MDKNNILGYKQSNKYNKPSKVIRVGKLLFILKKQPIDPETGEVIYDDFSKALQICMESLRTDIESEGATVEDVARITVYLRRQEDLKAIDEFFFTFFRGKLPVKKIVEVNNETYFPVQIDAMAIAR